MGFERLRLGEIFRMLDPFFKLAIALSKELFLLWATFLIPGIPEWVGGTGGVSLLGGGRAFWRMCGEDLM